MNEDIFRGNGVEIELHSPDDFLKVVETLTRIGIVSRKDKKLFQSCHILHKQGRYAILHFKELFLLDNKEGTFSNEDLARRNAIVNLLEEWNLVNVIRPNEIEDPVASLSQIKVLPYREKEHWELIPKYSIGKR